MSARTAQRPFDVHLYAAPEKGYALTLPGEAPRNYRAQTVQAFSLGVLSVTSFAQGLRTPENESEGPFTIAMDPDRAIRFAKMCGQLYVNEEIRSFDCLSSLLYVLDVIDTPGIPYSPLTLDYDTQATEQFEPGEGYVLRRADGSTPYFAMGAHHPDYLVSTITHNGPMFLASGAEFNKAFATESIHRIISIQQKT